MRSQISAELNLSWQQGFITLETTLFTVQLPVISFVKLLIVSKRFLFLAFVKAKVAFSLQQGLIFGLWPW